MIIRYPYVSEKASMDMEYESKLQFIVDDRATKKQIASEIEKLFDQKVKSVNTMMTMKGHKKAIVCFENEKAGEEILSRLGIM